MKISNRIITFKGNKLNLTGRILKEESIAPAFTLVSGDMQEVKLSDFKDKIKIIFTFPSLDTPVCDLEVKEFNKKSGDIFSDVVIIGISKDLPFAQSRFCINNQIKNIKILLMQNIL